MSTYLSEEVEKALKLEGGLVLRTLLLMFLLAGLYFIFFALRRSPLGGPEAWGQFGDYFGGVANPILGLVTLILVVRTLRTTRQEAAQTRVHLEEQTRQMRSQTLHFEKQSAMAEVQKRLDGTLSAWHESLLQPASGLVRLHSSGSGLAYVPQEWDLRKTLYFPALVGELSTLMKGPTSQELVRIWAPAMEPFLQMLDEFKKYCEEYDALSENKNLTDYYRHRIQSPLRAVLALKLSAAGEYDSLLTGLKFREFL